VLAKLLHHNIRWDSETIGCEPSLSSIPAAEQRTLLTAMQELADWLAMPQNEKEFLIVFFDDQMDLASWVSKDGLYLLSMLQLWWRLLSTPTLLPMLAPCATACPKKSISDTFPFLSSSRSRTL